jgi:hypothetical protein
MNVREQLWMKYDLFLERERNEPDFPINLTRWNLVMRAFFLPVFRLHSQ